ncbi:MAG: glycosyltransferase [Candidatus Cloacimonetes bacterium]|jgi:cellulose synthase/poly-beta-1,6-N-acetylglucosamine synthase-like glycosyltransferase|nr:glycosyltransferase [Candidatus Cloacimonadota bacterium]MDD4155260.1 glycosyltransferase [Candidatus Cloacimonadota bacterium]
MIFLTIFVISVLVFSIYVYYILKFKKNYYLDYCIKTSKTINVSVIVCARNEEENIEDLIISLVNQDYKTDLSRPLYEIIIANDQSEDNTEVILKKYSNIYNNIQYFNVENRENVFSPKKNALSQAIYRAKGKIILLTDADCIPTNNWISSHVATYEKYPDTEFVVGFSKICINNKNKLDDISFDEFKKLPLVTKFEFFDFLVLMFAAQGAIQSGKAFACSGQNISYLKTGFYEVNGFSDINKYISGDDLHLMQKFAKHKKKIRFNAFEDAYTVTQPVSDWKQLINQRTRWASNMKVMFKTNAEFFMYLVSSFYCIALMPFLCPLLYVLKYFADISFIDYALIHNQLYDTVNPKENIIHLVPIFGKIRYLYWFLISPIYILTVTVLGLLSIFKWKDRRG